MKRSCRRRREGSLDVLLSERALPDDVPVVDDRERQTGNSCLDAERFEVPLEQGEHLIAGGRQREAELQHRDCEDDCKRTHG
jgi:hypothetical protein